MITERQTLASNSETENASRAFTGQVHRFKSAVYSGRMTKMKKINTRYEVNPTSDTYLVCPTPPLSNPAVKICCTMIQRTLPPHPS
jgi:hypothetical protein